MKSRKSKNGLIGKLVFFIPLIVIVSVVVYGFIQVTEPVTLEVQAQAQNKYVSSAEPQQLQVSATVSGTSGTYTVTTPGSLSVSSGTYTVTYGSIAWYTTPSPRTIEGSSGQKVYAVGVYVATPSVVSITQSGFNATQVSALHDVTPVTWINNSGSNIVLSIENNGNEPLAPGQNATIVFQKAGSFSYSFDTNASGTVYVS